VCERPLGSDQVVKQAPVGRVVVAPPGRKMVAKLLSDSGEPG